MRFIAVFVLLCVLSVSATPATFRAIPCRVIGAGQGAITCTPIGDWTHGMMFTFWYDRETRARSYPRAGRRIIAYYRLDRNYLMLEDWFRLPR